MVFAPVRKLTSIATPVEDALAELSPDLFTLWIRLMLVPRGDLVRGVAHLARVIGMTYAKLDRRLDGLHGVGYVRLISTEVKEVHIAKRCMIVARGTHFVSL